MNRSRHDFEFVDLSREGGFSIGGRMLNLTGMLGNWLALSGFKTIQALAKQLSFLLFRYFMSTFR